MVPTGGFPLWLVALLVPFAATTAGSAPVPNLYEWVAVSPIVVAGEVRGEEGKHTTLRVQRVLRGDVPVDDRLLLDLHRANRDREPDTDPHRLRLEIGVTYVLLLEEAPPRKDGARIFRLVRGVHGARELPAEGAGPILDALARFVEIQDRRDEAQTWSSFAAILEDAPNPVLVENALDQFLKFQRAGPQHLASLVPLLDHPSPEIRERAARLVGQVVQRHGQESIPDEAALRGALFARARRDSAVTVRVAACEAIEGFGDLAALELLREIAAADPEQLVRYAAQRLLYERKTKAGAETVHQ